MSDEITRLRIIDALRADSNVSSQAITVDVAQRVACLRGSVHSNRSRLRARELAAAVEGVDEVLDELEVHEPGEHSDMEVCEQVRALLEGAPDIAKEAIVVSVASGRVWLDGAVGSEHERVLAADVALAAPGAHEVTNRLMISEPDKIEAVTVGRELAYELANDARLLGCDLRFASSGSLGVLSGSAPDEETLRVAEDLVRQSWAGELRIEVLLRR